MNEKYKKWVVQVRLWLLSFLFFTSQSEKLKQKKSKNLNVWQYLGVREYFLNFVGRSFCDLGLKECWEELGFAGRKFTFSFKFCDIFKVDIVKFRAKKVEN